MARVPGPKTNFRVVVEPRGLGDMGFISMSDRMACGNDPDRIRRGYEERCDEIAQQIKRHIDNVATARVEYDEDPVCSHCGRDWTEESSAYNGGCCDADEAGAQP